MQNLRLPQELIDLVLLRSGNDKGITELGSEWCKNNQRRRIYKESLPIFKKKIKQVNKELTHNSGLLGIYSGIIKNHRFLNTVVPPGTSVVLNVSHNCSNRNEVCSHEERLFYAPDELVDNLPDLDLKHIHNADKIIQGGPIDFESDSEGDTDDEESGEFDSESEEPQLEGDTESESGEFDSESEEPQLEGDTESESGEIYRSSLDDTRFTNGVKLIYELAMMNVYDDITVCENPLVLNKLDIIQAEWSITCEEREAHIKYKSRFKSLLK